MADSTSKTAIRPTRADDFPEWYQQVVRAADLAENSDVRGCMVIKPWGYGIWENIQHQLDYMFKATGHKNAYFPLFIPLSYFEAEAAHVEGFAKECAVVAHQRLEIGTEGKMVCANRRLNEPPVVGDVGNHYLATFAKWAQSPRSSHLINQRANGVLASRAAFGALLVLWQEGHTAHESNGKRRIVVKCSSWPATLRNHLAIPFITRKDVEWGILALYKPHIESMVRIVKLQWRPFSPEFRWRIFALSGMAARNARTTSGACTRLVVLSS
jgi:prolyl-tRNA synthetase